MRYGVIAVVAFLALATGATAAPPENIGLLYTQELGALERGDSEPHRYVCTAPPSGGTGRKVTLRDGRALDPAVSPLGSAIAYVSAVAATATTASCCAKVRIECRPARATTR